MRGEGGEGKRESERKKEREGKTEGCDILISPPKRFGWLKVLNLQYKFDTWRLVLKKCV